MTQQDVADHMASMDDAALRRAIETVKVDLAEAAKHHPNSERHEECFAAAILYAEEAQRRGLVITTTH